MSVRVLRYGNKYSSDKDRNDAVPDDEECSQWMLTLCEASAVRPQARSKQWSMHAGSASVCAVLVYIALTLQVLIMLLKLKNLNFNSHSNL